MTDVSPIATNARFDLLAASELQMLIAFVGKPISKPQRFYFWLWTHANEEINRRFRVVAGDVIEPRSPLIDPAEYTSYEVALIAESATLVAQVLCQQGMTAAANAVTQASVALIGSKLMAHAIDRGEIGPRQPFPWVITSEVDHVG